MRTDSTDLRFDTSPDVNKHDLVRALLVAYKCCGMAVVPERLALKSRVSQEKTLFDTFAGTKSFGGRSSSPYALDL